MHYIILYSCVLMCVVFRVGAIRCSDAVDGLIVVIVCGAHQIYHLIATQSEAKILVWPSCGNICLCMAGGCPPLYIQYTVELETNLREV